MKNYFFNIVEKIYILQNIYLKNKFFLKRKTYSMDREDLEIDKYFENVVNGFYVDLGCYHPLKNNNTMLLRRKGWNGINVDISEFSIKLFNYCRPNDLNLNLAVSDKNSEINFYYQKKISALSTIKKSRINSVFQGRVLEKKILSKTLTKILDDSIYRNRQIDFLNIDIEGADLDALKTLDFSRYLPKLICIEILPESLTGEDKDITKSYTYNFLKEKNYTHIWSNLFSHIFSKN
jgi:FkbM family methyltransferase